MKYFQRFVAGAAAMGFAFAPIEGIAATKYRADYTISYLGLPVAKSSFTSTINGKNYSVKGSLRSAGLVRVIDKTNGSTFANGYLTSKGAQPTAFSLSYTSGKKAKSTQINFKGGNVIATSNAPKVIQKGKWKAVRTADLRSVVDPLSSTLIRGNTPQKLCNRTIRVFDGKMRGNVKLSYASQRPFSTKGFNGNTIVCTGRFVPVSGYNQNKKDIIWMRNNGRVSIAFAALGEADLYAPVTADIKTRRGTVRVRASRFQVTQ